MASPRLTWRVGLPFVLLVLLGTVVLGAVMSRHVSNTESERFMRIADTMAAFLEQQSFRPEDGVARDLERVAGYSVFFRGRNGVDPQPTGDLAQLPLATLAADGHSKRSGDHECIAVPMAGKGDLVLVRRVSSGLLDPLVLQALAALGVLAILIAWLVGRNLVGPLHNLARQLPRIEQPDAVDVPEARRDDEIGDVARAFLRARQALRDEQSARERMEKLAALGRMTAALAHEVQNPVAAIRMHAQLLRSGDHDGAATTIEHEAARIESLLNQWMFLTRPEPPAVADIDIGQNLARVVAMHAAQADHAAVRVELDRAADLLASADGRRIEQVFRNLLTNALQAMPTGGTLTITARRAGDSLQIRFADTGRGFSATALQRFAEFFYSEKEGGMGIGLSVASEVLKAHGGRLTAANRDGGGAVVTVELPARTALPSRAAGSA
jgi:signal transduction histidine kinase